MEELGKEGMKEASNQGRQGKARYEGREGGGKCY